MGIHLLVHIERKHIESTKNNKNCEPDSVKL